MTASATERPTIAVVVAVLMLLFGASALVDGVQTTMTPVSPASSAEFTATVNTSRDGPMDPQTQATADQMLGWINTLTSALTYPAWYADWRPVIGVLETLVAGFYLAAAVMVLRAMAGARRLCIAALALAIAGAVAKLVLFASSGSALAAGAVFSVLVDLVLLAMVWWGWRVLDAQPAAAPATKAEPVPVDPADLQAMTHPTPAATPMPTPGERGGDDSRWARPSD